MNRLLSYFSPLIMHKSACTTVHANIANIPSNLHSWQWYVYPINPKCMFYVKRITYWLTCSITDYTWTNHVYMYVRPSAANLNVWDDILFNHVSWGTCSVWLSDFLHGQLAKISVCDKPSGVNIAGCDLPLEKDHWPVCYSLSSQMTCHQHTVKYCHANHYVDNTTVSELADCM